MDASQPTHLPALPEDERVLLLLGLLTSQDRHGYEINDFIENQLHCVTHLKKATAYLLLDRLEQHDLIHSRIEQQSLKPNRKVFTLTGRGHAHFLTLLSTQLRQEEPLIVPGNIPVMFHEHLPPEDQQIALQERLEKLEQRLISYEFLLSRVSLTTGVGLAMQRIQVLTQADLDWTRQLLERLAPPSPEAAPL